MEHKSSRSVETRTLIKGEIVLVNEQNAPRDKWKLAKTKELDMSQDQKVRSALIELPCEKLVNRPINMLCPLEIKQEKTSKTLMRNLQMKSVNKKNP